MVARSKRPGARSSRHTFRDFCPGRKPWPGDRGRRTGKQLQAGRDASVSRTRRGHRSRETGNAVALLGSATPALETYHNATSGKYELLTMASRVENRSLAAVEIVDLRTEFQQTHQTSPISKILHDGIAECLSLNTQALILINRRGYSWSVLCRSCGASVQCANCSISMTYHKS